MKTKTKIIFIFLILNFISCDYLPDVQIGDQDYIFRPTPEPDSTPVPTPTLEPENPIVLVSEKFTDGNGGNLWKPVSDTSGNLVIVLSSKFKKEFSLGCTLKKTNGETEKLFCGGVYKCFGNPDRGGDRLHLRSKIKCNQAKEVKVICKEEKQEITFSVDAAKLSEVCKRHD